MEKIVKLETKKNKNLENLKICTKRPFEMEAHSLSIQFCFE